MKKGWKIFWSVCGITAVIGFVCCAIAWGIGFTGEEINAHFPDGIGFVKNRWNRTDGGKYIKEDTHESFQNVQDIDIDLFAGQVKILPSSNDDIVVETKGISEKLGFQCYVDDDMLKLTSKKKLWGINNVGVGSIYVYVPKDMTFNEANIDIGAGSIEIKKLYADVLSVDVGAGEVLVEDFYANEADFDCGAGKITAFGGVNQEMNIDCLTGEIEVTLKGNENDYNYNIDCGVGEVNCGTYQYSGLARENTVDNHADKDINIDCGVGEITVNFENM